MTTHAPTITTPLPPHTTSKPQQSQRTKHHHNLNVVVVPSARNHRTHNLVTTRRGRLIHNVIHSRVRRSRMHNPRRATTACTVESCLVLVAANRATVALVTECLSDGGPGDVALTLSGGDGLRARRTVHLEHVPAIPLTGHVPLYVRTGGQASRGRSLHRTYPHPAGARRLSRIPPPQIRDAAVLLNDERLTRTIPHRAGVPQARPILLILGLTSRHTRNINRGPSRSQHPRTRRRLHTITGVGGRTTRQGHKPSHKGHHHAAHNLARHHRSSHCSPHRRGRAADDPNHTPHQRAHVNPQTHKHQRDLHHRTHVHTQPPTHTPTHTHAHTTNTQPPQHTNTAHTNTNQRLDQHKHQTSRRRNNHTQKNKPQAAQGITPRPTSADRYACYVGGS